MSVIFDIKRVFWSNQSVDNYFYFSRKAPKSIRGKKQKYDFSCLKSAFFFRGNLIEFLIFSYTMKGRKEMNIMNSLCIKKVMLAFMLGFPVLYSQAEEPAVMPVLPDTIAAPHTVKSEGTVQVAFSPRGGGQDIINNALHEADRSIMVQAYLFSNKSIAAQLEAASQRGVSVQVI